jgi:hypothetical protein
MAENAKYLGEMRLGNEPWSIPLDDVDWFNLLALPGKLGCRLSKKRRAQKKPILT